ncbi:MAG: nucleoside recognition domain-containing protein [Moraxellaceae bacterium]|nr:nucleoside recognition domain-containing protein [Moraxellaceae bacterium]
MLNILWLTFFAITVLICAWQAFVLGDLNSFNTVVQAWFNAARVSVDISIGLVGIMTLWLGLFRVADKSGLVTVVGRGLQPLFLRLMPEVPKGHPAYGAVTMNLSANVLGLDNAATPLGLQAMRELQKLNPEPERATKAQALFLVLNASSVTLVPVSVFLYRAQQGAADPANVFLPILLATSASTIVGLTAICLLHRIKLLDKVILAYGAAFAFVIASVIWLLTQLPADQLNPISSAIGNGVLVFVIAFFLLSGVAKKIPVYAEFIEGAKEGFQTAIGLIPYLLAMLVAIAGLRASGAMDLALNAISDFLALMGWANEFVPALTTALMKPLSGSGARAMMIETMQTYGVDSFSALVAAVIQGSSETTLYVVAVYYGVVGIKRDRGALACGLLADLAGVSVAIMAAYWFFPFAL